MANAINPKKCCASEPESELEDCAANNLDPIARKNRLASTMYTAMIDIPVAIP